MVINIHFKPFKGLILHLNILRESSLFVGGSKMVQSSHKKRLYQSTKTQWLFQSWPCISSAERKSRTNSRQMYKVWFYWIPRASPLRQQSNQLAHRQIFYVGNGKVILKYPPHMLWLRQSVQQRAPNWWVWETNPRSPGFPVSEKVVCLLTQGRSPPALPWKEIYFCK